MDIRHFTASDGARLAFRDQGQGPVVIALAGLTRNGLDFDHLVPHLPPVRLIRPDYRGRGASDWTGAETYTVPREAQDVLELMDLLGIPRAAILGTSRGGMIGMYLAAVAHDRLSGLCLNDIGPVLERAGLDRIKGYVGRQPNARSHAEMAQILARTMAGFPGVPEQRWLEESRHHYLETPEGLRINYDPALRESFLAAFDGPEIDLWPMFDAARDLPLALIRGANSDLLSPKTAAEMRRRRPDMLFAEIPDRAHPPFLDEPEAVEVIRAWLARIG